MKKRIVFLASSLIFVSQISFANAIDERQGNQRDRISDGVQSGELTARETGRLARQQAHIRATEVRYKYDGDFTARERASLHRKQTRASANIYRQKHDLQDRD